MFYIEQETRSYKHCTVTHHSIMFFIRWSTEHCDYDDINEKDPFYESIPKTDMKTEILGGDPGFIAKLLVFNKHSVKENARTFSQWSGSVKEFPGIIKSKMRSLHELVKEVPCAGLKRLLLKRAIETYLTEKHPCQCRACQNNGLRVLDQDVCKCVCKPGTSGLACEESAPHNEQPGMIHGDWACWSSWSSCSDGKKSRSRTCSRPSPSGGGRNCAGDTEETGACDEEDELNHLRMMEPHCFDESLTPRKSCTTPPFLANGFVLHPKDFYSVGSKVEYTCIEGYRLTGNAFIACQENLEWYPPAMECKRTVCIPPQLPPDVSASPWTLSYKTGDAVTLSCPEGQLREGPGQIRCNAGLAWSPQPKNIKCIKAPTPTSAPMQCQPWENLAKDKCVCKMPTECKLSLELCATDAQHSRTLRLTVCKIQASRCLGHPFSLAEDSACQWPQRSSTACTQCTAWETCDEQTKSCRCKSIEECSSLGAWIKVCVQQDENSAPVTMTECEAAVRRCRGETVRILNILKCPT
ncbi:hypothetical protein DNTS_035346 [Danionella cerebrum]|uniref:Complement component C7 n=1 Tax=Danionella cerebrum TaxID=2873325 RepID=A0A553R0V5_9TELE|nr:hypothetical protein DNTS_035346 [Danionella translucida]